jgi:class I lanthipeptide synthase
MNFQINGQWRPLVAGELAEETWRAILEIAAALASEVASDAVAARAPADDQAAINAAGLANGSAGLALLFSYLAEARGDAACADAAMAHLERSLDGMASLAMSPALFSGFTGVAWTAKHLEGRLFEPGEGGDGEDPVLETLLSLLQPGTWAGDYDLVNGLVGFGVYALAALPRPAARQCLEALVEDLASLAEERPPGIAWFTPSEWLPPHHRALAPAGYCNLGVAHGVPGVIAVLGEICGAGLAADRAYPLLERAVAWLLAQEHDTGSGRCFPHFQYEGAPREESRLAWCYGDPGIAATLLAAARRTGRDDWERKAVETALRAARRPLESSRVLDVGLCHGAAGLVHLFNRLCQATGREELAEAARFWLRRTLAMRRPGEGVAGFLAWDSWKGGWVAERGFLTGVAGVALALLGAVTAVEPAWDGVLLTSISSTATAGGTR